jgi:adenylate cyclase
MLRFQFAGRSGRSEVALAEGPLIIGREPQAAAGARVHAVDDAYLSRSHVWVEERPGGQILVKNLSGKRPIELGAGKSLGPGESGETSLPARLTAGQTLIDVALGDPSASGSEPAAYATIDRAAAMTGRTLASLGGAPDPAELARWFETVVTVQRAAAGSPQFFAEAARAVTELIGLDRGLVLLRRAGGWEVVARHDRSAAEGTEFSQGVLAKVLQERTTVYQGALATWPTESLARVAAVVASPIFDATGAELVGVVYGARFRTATGHAVPSIRALEAQVTQVLAAALGAGLARQRGEAEAARRRLQLEQFTSPELARALDADPELLEGREREVTILCSDLRGFSRLAEALGARTAFRLAQDVLERLTERIADEGGTIVDYAGDGILAMWNAPLEQPDHAARACRAGLAMLGEMPALRGRWADTAGGPLGLGIGINTGTVLVGNTGGRRRLKYGPLGHAVNLACRIEGATKQLGVPALLSSATRAALDTPFATRRLCRVRVVGVATPVDLFELYPGADPAAESWLARRDAYEAALAAYENADWAAACRSLQPLLAEGGHDDLPTLALLGRAVERLKTPGLPFDPVVELGSK